MRDSSAGNQDRFTDTQCIFLHPFVDITKQKIQLSIA